MHEGDVQASRRTKAEVAAARLVGSRALVPSLAMLIDLGAEYVDLLASVQHPPMPAEVREGVRAFLSVGHLDEQANPDSVWGLIVEALVLNLPSTEPSAAVIHKTERQLRAAPYWVHDAWRERVAERIRSMEAPQQAAWIAALGLEPTPRAVGNEAKATVRIRRSAAPWAVESPFELWDESPAALDGNWYAPLQILARLDQNAWFGALDLWRDTRLVHTAFFFGALHSSSDRILVGVQAARVRPEGELSASVTLLCEEAVDAAEELIKTGEESNVDSAREFLDKFSRTLLSRPDGPQIGAAHAARLLGFKVLNRKEEGAAKRATELALVEILRHLGLARVQASAQKAYWTERKRSTSRFFVRHELLALFVARRSLEVWRRAGDSDDLFAWLREALELSREWNNREAIDDFREELVALLRMSTSPIESCKSLFEALETDRRRLERGRAHDDGPSLVPSLLLLVAFVELLHAHESPDWLEQVTYVRDRATRAALVTTADSQSALRPREVVAMTMHLVCARFGSTDARALNFAAPAAADAETMALLLARLRKTGDDVQAFVRAMRLDAAELVGFARARVQALDTPSAQMISETIARALEADPSPVLE